MTIEISPGKAYVRGYEIEKFGTTFIDLEKARDFDTASGVVTRFAQLPFVNVTNIFGTPDIGFVSGETEVYKKVAKQLFKKHSTLFLGRGLYFPIAREGALKLKEISYIHAEAYPGGELKHGPLALIDKDMPVIALVPDNEHLDKITSNIAEVAARKGKVFTIGPLGKTIIDKEGGHIKIPKTLDLLNPIISVVPMQLIAYYTAVFKGTDVDKPRNLAKSVTVE